MGVTSSIATTTTTTTSIMLLRIELVILAVWTTSAMASITFSCFSYPLFDFPSLGFSSTSGLFVNSDSNILSNVGGHNKTSADFCFFAIASVLLLEVFPSLLSSQGGEILRRISGRPELEQTAEDIPASLEGPVQRYIMPGTRRLDMDVAEYEYVDTLPPREPINFRKHLSPEPPIGLAGERRYEQPGEIVSNSLVHSASPAISPGQESQWSSPLDQTDEYSWTVQEQEIPGGLDNSVQQDYQDIDYTSGSLVSFHTSLSK